MDQLAYMHRWIKLQGSKLPPGFHVVRMTDLEWFGLRMLPSFGLKKSFNPGWPGTNLG